MLDDGAADLFGGFWPFMRRFLFMFLPLWVFLIGYTAGLHVIFASILAGASISVVAIFEKYKLKQGSEEYSDGNNLIK
tara:strand:+ start:7309 stop:7542 length:234 start_codon:yes stop_codon:yes gene_type:complete